MKKTNLFKKIVGWGFAAIISIIVWYITISNFISNEQMNVMTPLGTSKPPNSRIVYSKEGYLNTRVDEFGFNNDAMNEGLPYVYFHGDSYTEAYQVSRDKNYVSRLNNRLKKYNFYNYGKSGNSLADYIVEKKYFTNQKDSMFHFFQINNSDFLDDSTNKAKQIYIRQSEDSTYEIIVQTNEEIYGKFACAVAEKVPALYGFMRYTYNKYELITKDSDTSNILSVMDFNSLEDKKKLISWELHQMKSAYGDQFAFIYIARLPKITNEGLITEETDEENEIKQFLFNECQVLNIDIIDITQGQIDYYKETNQMSIGFNNTKIGEGHINRIGHRIVADQIEDYLLKEGIVN